MIHLLKLKNAPILTQLKVEEALLRVDKRNWCLINEGTNPAIVMGISGKKEELIDQQKLALNPIPVVKRFSGGGTVFVDANTLFITFIFNHSFLPIAPFPKNIMAWTSQFYEPFFHPFPFQLQDNDYVFNQQKFGGNAQSIIKDRWLHHTSFLWDYDLTNMDYLLLPKKIPNYRQGRNHSDFLCKLGAVGHWKSKANFMEKFVQYLKDKQSIHELNHVDIENILNTPHRQATNQI